jgi:type IV secretion system protein TrbL
MRDLSVIDRFLDVFSRYIDSGFGLLGGEIAFLTATLVVIDMTLAGLFWALGHASGQGDDVLAKLIKKVLYVGSFAFIIGNFNQLAGIVFRSFAGLGLLASGSAIGPAELLQPGRLAKVGVDAGRPIMAQISDLTGFPEVFANLDVIAVLFLAWLVLIVSFFVLAVQLFVTLIEFKLTTLAGFVLVPFALWNKTAFLAERVLGHVVSSGIKVLVLAVIVGIGTGLFREFTIPPGTEPSIDHALTIMLAAIAMFGLGIFGPGIATGLVAGGPQLGAGAAAGTALGLTGLGAAGVAAAGMGASAVAAGARLATRGGRAGAAAGAATRSSAASAATPMTAAGATAKPATSTAQGASIAANARPASNTAGASTAPKTPAVSPATGDSGDSGDDTPPTRADTPAWARRLQRRQRLSQGLSMAMHSVRGGEHGGGGANPSLRDPSN